MWAASLMLCFGCKTVRCEDGGFVVGGGDSCGSGSSGGGGCAVRRELYLDTQTKRKIERNENIFN